jgi:uncharacterized repeat protein (TIGR01451 family)
MKKIIFLWIGYTILFTVPAVAQWSWKGQLYFGTNQNLFIPVVFIDSVEITIAQGFTVRSPGSVTGNGYPMCKKGGGRFWFQADNPLFDSNIIYAGNSDTVQLNGIFGQFINDSIGYLYTGSLISSDDSTSFFYLNQNDTVVQTFDASGYNNTNTNLYIYSDTGSTLRIIKSSDSLAGRVHFSKGGVLYMDGTYNAEVSVTGGKLITGENSVAVPAVHHDYAIFRNTFNDSTLTISASIMQIGTYKGPSLVHVASGNIYQDAGSTLEIDVYNPNTNWNLTPGIHPEWVYQTSFSDKIYLAGGDYKFEANSRINVSWDPVYMASIMDDTVFYLPVIMLNNPSLQHITGENNVTVNQTMPGWVLKFFIGDGNNGTQIGWAYIKGEEILPDNISDADCYVTPPATTWSMRETTLNNDVLIHNYGPLAVGDIDGNGTVEIIGYKESVATTNSYESPGLKLFHYNTSTNRIELKHEFLFATMGGATSATFGAMAIARYNDEGYIVVSGTDKHLYAYTPDGARKWKSTAQYHANEYGTVLGIADFNNDGIPEVYTGDQVFSLANNGNLLCDGGRSNSSGVLNPGTGHSTVAADMDGDGQLELVAGINIYKVNITDYTGTTNNSITLLPGMQLNASLLPVNAADDGATQVVDIDNDGKLEVVVISNTGGRAVAYVWKPLPDGHSYLMGSYPVPATGVGFYSIPMLGNIDDTPYPEIVFITNGTYSSSNYWKMYALQFNPLASAGSQISLKWELEHTNLSGCTGATLFDFNQDGINEIVYRDETRLRIIDGSADTAAVKTTELNVRSSTLREFPVIADIDHDGQAEIVVTGWDGNAKTIDGVESSSQNGYLRVFKANGSPWAPARSAWNQYAYNAVNINEDLTVPLYQMNPATVFPGKDGIWGTADDVRPYNNFLQQQTTLNRGGMPIWLAPDAVFDESQISTSVVGDSVSISICIVNQGDAALGSPVYVTLYRDSIKPENIIKTDSLARYILPGDTDCLTVGIRDINPFLPFVQLIVRLNDNGLTYPVQDECDCDDSIRMRLNPAIHLMMKKDATLNGMQENGTCHNPVSILLNENIIYKITAVNANTQAGQVVITDTLPPYLSLIPGSYSDASISTASGTPSRGIISWTKHVGSLDSVKVSYQATPESGASASQLLYINQAWVRVSDTVHVRTNRTYHQGAGISIVIFSASAGGQLYHAEPQALDFRTSPREGVLIVPDEGYEFAGWSHGDYVSLRGDTVKAASSILHYEDIVIYGNVELRADFIPIDDQPIKRIVEGKAPDNKNKIWSNDRNLHIFARKGAITHIYTLEGILRRQFTISEDGITTIRLERGIYIVTLDGTGYKVRIE